MASTDYYTIPSGNDTSSMYNLYHWIGGETTTGLFFPVMLLVIWVISFMALKQYSTSRAFTFSSFLCSVIGIMMAVMDLINPRWMYLTVFMVLVGFVWLKLENSTD